MKRVSVWVLVGVLAFGGSLSAQKRGQSTSSAGAGKATARSSGGSGSSGRAASAPSGSSGGQSRAAGEARRASSSGSSDGSSSGATRARSAPRSDASGSTGSTGDTAVIRAREGQPVKGEAVARRPSSGNGGGGGGTVIVPGYWGGYYPWGYAGLGFGGYYGGFYDPFWYGGGPYGYGGGGGYYNDDGALRLKVEPREASVYVDGYFAGQVDDYDGVFQKLRMESGPHRVELRADGYEPLMFEVRIQPDRTITYKGEMREALAPEADQQ